MLGTIIPIGRSPGPVETHKVLARSRQRSTWLPDRLLLVALAST
jgi:hypothetical protein